MREKIIPNFTDNEESDTNMLSERIKIKKEKLDELIIKKELITTKNHINDLLDDKMNSENMEEIQDAYFNNRLKRMSSKTDLEDDF